MVYVVPTCLFFTHSLVMSVVSSIHMLPMWCTFDLHVTYTPRFRDYFHTFVFHLFILYIPDKKYCFFTLFFFHTKVIFFGSYISLNFYKAKKELIMHTVDPPKTVVNTILTLQVQCDQPMLSAQSDLLNS